MMTHHSVITSSLRIKISLILTNLIFRAISIITVGQTYLEMLSPIQSINGDHRRLRRTVSASREARASEARLSIEY